MKLVGLVLFVGIAAFLTSLAYSLGHNTLGSTGSGDDLMTALGLVGAMLSIVTGVTLAIRPMLKRVDVAVNNSATPLSDRVDEMLVEQKMTSKMVAAISESQANLSLEVLSLSTRLDDHIAKTTERTI